MLNNKKVIHVITRLIRGGADENTYLTCLGLQQKGWETILVYGEECNVDLEPLIRAGVKLVQIPELVRNPSIKKDYTALRKITRLCREEKPLFMHTHTAKAGVVGRYAAQLAGVPIIIHGLHGASVDAAENKIKKEVFRLIEKIAALRTTYYISVGQDLLNRLVSLGLADPSKSAIVRSGFELANFKNSYQHREEYRKRLGLEPDEIAIGMIARVAPQKGYDFFLEASKMLLNHNPKIKVFSVGSLDIKDYAEDILAKAQPLLATGRVAFAGGQPKQEVPNYIAAMDVIILTSLWEGLPRTIVESLSCNKPVVCFEVDGAKEVVVNGVNGYVVPSKNTGELVDKVKYILDHMDEFANGVRKINENLISQFDWRVMVEETEKIYLKLAAERGGL